MTYQRLTDLEREHIMLCLRDNISMSQIARDLGRARSTITREVKRFMAGLFEMFPPDVFPNWHYPLTPQCSYSATTAGHGARISKTKQRKRRKLLHPPLWSRVLGLLRLRWSPQQIAARLKKDHPNEPEWHVSHETIYLYVYATPRGPLRDELKSLMRRKESLTRTLAGTRRKGSTMLDMTPIEDRPDEVLGRVIPGHWEADLIVGKDHGSFLGVFSERVSRYAMLVKLDNKTAAHVRERFAPALLTLPDALRLSVTYDQGSEMAQHKQLTEETGAKVFFCNPHSPWEKGGVENLNGLLRQYFPKSTDLSKYDAEHLKMVQEQLNGRPRKTLDWATPAEVMKAQMETAVALAS